jgi:FkbM family methyltransferase
MKTKLMFDIGFNHGNFTRQFLRYYPNSKVIGVDANLPFLNLFRQHPIPNVEFIHSVVSDKNSEDVDFYVCDSNLDISSINPEFIENIRHNHFYNNGKRLVKMNSITLDFLIEKYGTPDMIKLDIEGAESLALSGLSKKVELITFEWAEDYFKNTLKCIDILKTLGFTQFANTEQSDLLQNVEYKLWEDLGIVNDIDSTRKQRWGTIYAK